MKLSERIRNPKTNNFGALADEVVDLERDLKYCQIDKEGMQIVINMRESELEAMERNFLRLTQEASAGCWCVVEGPGNIGVSCGKKVIAIVKEVPACADHLAAAQKE